MPADAPAAFFSYCRDDSDFALRLAEDLKAAGAVVWIDQLDIDPGQRWDRAVEDALNRCPRMLVVLSPASVQSDNVRDEISFALRKQKTIIPVLHLDCDIPLRLERHQHIDFRADHARGLKVLLRALGVQPLPQAITPATPAPMKGRSVASDKRKRKPAPKKRAQPARKATAEEIQKWQEISQRMKAARDLMTEKPAIGAPKEADARGAARKAGLKEENAETTEPAPLQQEGGTLVLRELRTLAGHTELIRGVAVTLDGKRAVSASDDKTLKVWDLETGSALRTLEGHSD